MKTLKPKILSVRIEHKLDDSPDTSHLGRYSDACSGMAEAGYAIVANGGHAGEFVCDLPQGDLPVRGRKYRFFIPCSENYLGCTEGEIRKYCLQDYELMESLNRGDWCYLGVISKAEIQLGKSPLIQVIHSAGLWGVESDCKDYLKEVAKGELEALRVELSGVGFSNRTISRAFRNVIEPE